MSQNLPETKLKRKPRLWVIFLSILLILLMGASAGAWWAWNTYQTILSPVGGTDEEFLVTVPRGASSGQIGQILAEQGLVHDARAFGLYLRYYELDGKIQAGTYYLSPAYSLAEIVDKLVAGQVHRETIRFTVPEGMFILGIADRLAQRGIVDKERFLELVQDRELWDDFWFIQEIPANAEWFLEGYLFPDTYEIAADAEDREERVIRVMLRRFEQLFTQEMRERADDLGFSVHQVVTLSSIVEKEAVVDSERPLIAGVFHNRLKQRMMLQSCATVNYILKDFSIRALTTAQMNIKDPYNTYVNTGLPPGPIAAPGIRSLRATLWPEETNYLFFVAKDDGSNQHYFARTYAEHRSNIDKAARNRRK